MRLSCTVFDIKPVICRKSPILTHATCIWRRITQIKQHDSPGTVVFWCQRSPQNSTSGVPGPSAAAATGPPPQQLHSLPRVTISHIYRCMHYYTVHASLHRVQITKSEVGATTGGVPCWQNSAGRRRLTGGNIGSSMPPAGRRWAA